MTDFPIGSSGNIPDFKDKNEVPQGKIKDSKKESDIVKSKNDSVSINKNFTSNATVPNLGFGILAPEGWGIPSQIGGTYQDLLDVQGNKDGIWDNEQDISGKVNEIAPTWVGKPIASKIESSFDIGFTFTDEINSLVKFRITQENKWGEPVTNLNLNQLKDGELFAAQKAISLTRMDRKPSEVTDGFVSAKGKVNGVQIADREVFFQRFKPIGTPSGKVVVISPGFQETGRNFYEQIQQLNKQGHDVVVMDQQWSGQTKGGTPGGLDRGFGVARDVAAVAAYAQKEIVEKDYGKTGSELILFGNSMGAGPGVLGAMTLNDNGKISLEGEQMPKGVKAVLQAPFIKSTPEFINKSLNIFSKVPLVNKMPIPSTGLPILTHDNATAQKGIQGAVLEDVRAQLKTMSAANEDLDFIVKMINDGHGPQGQISIVHGNQDPLADPEQSRWLEKKLGNKVTLNIIESNNHVLEQNTAEQGFAVKALNNLIKK